jgi:hypothetical protein
MKRPCGALFAAGVLLVLGAVASACGGENGDEEGHEEGRYENAELGFAFDYPDDWEEIGEPVTLTIQAESRTDTLDRVVVGTKDEGGNLSGLVLDANVNRLETEMEINEAISQLDEIVEPGAGRAGLAVQEKDLTEVGGLPGKRYVMSFTLEDEPMTNEYVAVLSPGLTFELICEAPEERFAEVHTGCQMVMDSFEFTPEQ